VAADEASQIHCLQDLWPMCGPPRKFGRMHAPNRMTAAPPESWRAFAAHAKIYIRANVLENRSNALGHGARIQSLLKRGLQREADFENRWPALLGTLFESENQ
jgi:hypothetical protein